MEYWPDEIYDLPNNEGKAYSWYFDVDGVEHDFHQDNECPIVVLTQNEVSDLVNADLGGLSVADWMKLKDIQLFKEPINDER